MTINHTMTTLSCSTSNPTRNGENSQSTLPKPDQSTLFKKLKPLTVPVLGMLPIKNNVHSLQLLPIITAIKAILLDHSHPELISPPMIHYIFFPFEQLYHQVNLQALSESALNQLLDFSTILVRASKSHESNPLWTSKETLILNAILPILIQKTGSNESTEETDSNKASQWKPVRSDECASLALELMISILYPHSPSQSTKISLNLDDLYQNPPNLPNLSAYLLRFLFQHLVDILDTLYQIYASPKQSQPSLDRARKTIQLIRLGLLRLSSSNISDGNGVDILSTFLPSITSKLTQLACLLAPRRQSSDLLSLTLRTIEWILVECLDDELPDLQEIFASAQFLPVDGELDPDLPSESKIYDHVLEIASDWKLGQFTSTRTSPQAVTNLSSPASHQHKDSQEILVKRDQSWLRMTSAKVSIVLQRLSSCLDNHPSPIVQEAWVHVCFRLLERTSLALSITRSCTEEKNSNHPVLQEKDGFAVLVEALITARSNQNLNTADNKIDSLLVHVTRSVPLASFQLIIDFIRVNFRLLSSLLVKQVSGQDDLMISLSSRIISSLNVIIDLVTHQPRPADFYHSCFDLVDLNEFQNLSTSIFCRVHLLIPKVLDSQPDSGFLFGAGSIPDHPRDHSKTHQSDRETLPDSFPKLYVKQIFDHKCIKTLEELVCTISRLVLHSSYRFSGSSTKLSEIGYLDRLLQLTTTTKGAKPSDIQQRCLQLNALWTLGESIRALKSVATDDRYRARFSKIEIFCVQGLKKLLEMVESYRIEGRQNQEEKAKESESSELMAIRQGLDDLLVTSYSRGNDQLLELERLKPTSLSRKSDELIEEENFQGLRTCLILRLIASSVYVFEGSFQPNLSWVSYYVLAQLSSPNPYVSQHAMAAIGELSLYCGYGSISNMLEDNSDYLVHVLSHQLLPHQYDIQAPFVLEHLITLVGLRTMLPLVEQILLHDLFELLDDFHGYDLVCEQIISVFRCVMSLMNKEFKFEQAQRKLEVPNEEENKKKKSCQAENPIDEIFEIEQELAKIRWEFIGPATDIKTDLERFESLQLARKKREEFQRVSSWKDHEDMVEKNPQKPFGELDSNELKEKSEEDKEEEEDIKPMSGYQKIAAELLNKSANFLSHSDPKIRRGVSGLIKESMVILGSNGSNPQESKILTVIQKFWTIILSRLDQHQSDPQLAIETLSLLSQLCHDLSSFITRKLVEDIWPRIEQIITVDGFGGGEEDPICGGRRVGLSALHTICHIVHSYSNQAHKTKWPEKFVWSIIVSVLKLTERRSLGPIVLRIFRLLSAAGWSGSVQVATAASRGLVPALTFLAPPPIPSSSQFHSGSR